MFTDLTVLLVHISPLTFSTFAMYKAIMITFLILFRFKRLRLADQLQRQSDSLVGGEEGR